MGTSQGSVPSQSGGCGRDAPMQKLITRRWWWRPLQVAVIGGYFLLLWLSVRAYHLWQAQ
jgi:hypothetical protein